MNTGKYAKNCINKAKPKLHCNGKCQLMKKMQEEEKKDQENQERRLQNKYEESLTSKNNFANIDFQISGAKTSSHTFSRFHKISSGYLHGVFKPPCA